MSITAPRRPGIVHRIASAVSGWFAPASPVLSPFGRRSYAAAQMNRLTEGWSAVNYSANAELNSSLDALRGRSRQLCRDNPYARKFLQLCETNILGEEGFRHQARVYNSPKQPDTPANEALEAAWADWATVCDVTGRHNLRDLCGLLVRSAARDGEYMVRIVRGPDAGNAYQLALQVLDIDRLDTAYNRAASEGENQIRMGVEVNAYGRPVAYHLKRAAVNDPYASAVARTERLRLPADEVIHGFVADRAEQFRGVPWMHASMKALNDLSGYMEAAVIAARVGAAKMGFFTKNADAPEVAGAGVASEAEDGSLQMEADAGTFETLPEGYKFEAFNPDYPAAMYEPFVKANLRGIAVGQGVAYHALSGDLEGVSFSSIRSGTLEERDHWACLQRWFVNSFLERLYPEWLRNALAFGLVRFPTGSTLPASKFDKFKPHAFIGRRWEWVDPMRDIQADILAMEAGLASPQSIVAKMGGDYEDTLVEIKVAEDLRQKVGLQPAAPKPKKPAPGEEPANDDDAQAAA